MKKDISRRRRAAIDAYEAGLTALAENDIEQARTHLESVVAKHKSEIDVVERAQMRLGLLERAQQAVEPKGGFGSEMMFQLGVHAFNRGNPDLAKEHFTEAAAADSEAGAHARYNLACLASKVDLDLDRAEELLVQAAENRPELKESALRDPDLVLVVQKLGWTFEDLAEE